MPGSLPSPSKAVEKLKFKVRFQAVGEQCKLTERPTEYQKVYPNADAVPKPPKSEQHLAQVHARQLQEAVRVFDSKKPSCEFNCLEPSLT